MPLADDVKITYRGLYLFIIIAILIMIISGVVTGCKGQTQTNKEGWLTYKRGIDNTIRTGIDGYYPNGINGLPPSAPAFYLVPEYRMPYDWPRGFQTSYPINHAEPLVTLN